MIVVKFMGGMGNQLFQYAAGRALACRHRTGLKLDISFYQNQPPGVTPRHYALNWFNIREDFASPQEVESYTLTAKTLKNRTLRWLRKRIPFAAKQHLVESRYSFNDGMLSARRNTYIEGYWQTEKYFRHYEDVIRKEFTLKDGQGIRKKEIAGLIASSESVSLHIRRADYISDAATNKFHGLCPLEYYRGAVRYLSERAAEPHIFIFSDDIGWARENLTFSHPVTCVSDGILKDYEELMLMAMCRHNIIANSSFSWWGAWLNSNAGKMVIAPSRWFADSSIDTSDVIPETWHRFAC